MSKFKIGDTVRIREDLRTNRIYNGIGFVSGMRWFMGQTLTIEEIIYNPWGDNNIDHAYKLKEDESGHYWTDDMFDNNHNGKCDTCDCCNTCSREDCKYE